MTLPLGLRPPREEEAVGTPSLMSLSSRAGASYPSRRLVCSKTPHHTTHENHSKLRCYNITYHGLRRGREIVFVSTEPEYPKSSDMNDVNGNLLRLRCKELQAGRSADRVAFRRWDNRPHAAQPKLSRSYLRTWILYQLHRSQQILKNQVYLE